MTSPDFDLYIHTADAIGSYIIRGDHYTAVLLLHELIDRMGRDRAEQLMLNRDHMALVLGSASVNH